MKGTAAMKKHVLWGLVALGLGVLGGMYLAAETGFPRVGKLAPVKVG